LQAEVFILLQLLRQLVAVLGVRLHETLVDDSAQYVFARVRLLLLKPEAVYEQVALFESLDLETLGRLGVERAQSFENFGVEAHDAVFIDVVILTNFVENFLLGRPGRYEGAELHSWVKIEEELVVAEDGVSGEHDGRLVDLVLALHFERGVVKGEGAFHREVNLLHLIVCSYEAQPSILR